VAGYSNREIAEYFKIHEDTVKQHLNNIFDQLGVTTRLELALRAIGRLGGPEDGDTAGIAVKKPPTKFEQWLRREFR
jgi:hypothetical protein